MGRFQVSIASSGEPFFNHIEYEKYLMNYKVKYAGKQCHHRGCEYI